MWQIEVIYVLDLGLENMAVCCSEKQCDSDETLNYYCSTSPHVRLQLLELRNITIFASYGNIQNESVLKNITMTVHTNQILNNMIYAHNHQACCLIILFKSNLSDGIQLE